MNRRSFFTLLLAALGLGVKQRAQRNDPAWVPCDGQAIRFNPNYSAPVHVISRNEMPSHNHDIIDPGHSHGCDPWPCPLPKGYIAQWTNPDNIPGGWKRFQSEPPTIYGITDPGHSISSPIWIQKL